MTDRQRWRSQYALILCMGINTVVYSLSYPLLSLAMHQRGIGADIIGISTAIQGHRWRLSR